MNGYPRRHFLADDEETLRSVIASYPLATFVSVDAGRPVATQLPLVLDDAGRLGSSCLYGHMDRANPQWRSLDGARCLALFHGPQAYVSPRVVGLHRLPTWNYITVECHGRVRVTADSNEGADLAIRLSDRIDPGLGLQRSDPRVEALAPGIVGLVVEVDKVVGRMKLAQDRGPRDRRDAVDAMLAGLCPEDRAFTHRVAFPDDHAGT